MEVSADVDGFRLWYRVPKLYPLSRAGDAFLSSALLPAMRRGEKLEIDPTLPVSPKLLRNVFLLQEIFYSWNPKELKIIPVSANVSPAEPLNAGAVSFFSGGVDSTYTLLKRAKEISHVVHIQGFDFYVNSGGDSTFSVSDLADLSRFSYNLMLPYNAVYAFIKGKFLEMTKQALSNYRMSCSDPGTLETALVNDLNKIIAGQLIYETQRFRGINMRPQTRRLLAQEHQGEATRSLNRMLLEDACSELTRKGSVIYQTAIERHSCFLQSFGKILIPVETNHYPFGYRYNLSRNLTQGSVLASVAQLLGFSRVYVPASYSYSQLFPLGSHPLTDPLWSNECVEIIHDGCEAGRTDKLRKICGYESALTNLRVCFDDMNANCGKCLKCRRTMISLKLLHGSSGPFPPFPSLKKIRKERISNDIEMAFFKENVKLAEQSEDQDLRNALNACLRRNELRRLFLEFQRLFVGGMIKKTYRRIVKSPPGVGRIDTTPPRD